PKRSGRANAEKGAVTMATTAATWRTDEQIERATLAELEWGTDAAARRVDVARGVEGTELRPSSAPRPAATGTATTLRRTVDWDTVLPVEATAVSVAGVNLYEQDHRYILQIPLPGARPDRLTIDTRDNMVALMGAIEFAMPTGARAIFRSAGHGWFRE